MTDAMNILLVEDNPGDVLLTEEALDACAAEHTLRVIPDGAAALAQLKSDATTGDLPDLVVLDLNLPGMSGHDLLESIKGDGDLGALPVVMMTTSTYDADIRRCYELHGSCYVAKPVGLDGYFDAVHAIETFWGSTARLPARRGRPNAAVAS